MYPCNQNMYQRIPRLIVNIGIRGRQQQADFKNKHFTKNRREEFLFSKQLEILRSLKIIDVAVREKITFLMVYQSLLKLYWGDVCENFNMR